MSPPSAVGSFSSGVRRLRDQPWVGGMPAALIALITPLAWVPAPATAIGFGVAAETVPMGRPLDFSIPLRIDPGETGEPGCLAAAVSLGERKLPSEAVNVVLERLTADSARLRVLTSQVVDEPVVGVSVSAGCGGRITREYLLLADPPLMAAFPPAAAYAGAPMRVSEWAASLPSTGAAAGQLIADAGGHLAPSVFDAAAALATEPRQVDVGAGGPALAAAVSMAASLPAPVSPSVRTPAASASARPAPASTSAPSAPRAAAIPASTATAPSATGSERRTTSAGRPAASTVAQLSAPAPRPASAPRLRLDPPEPVLSAEDQVVEAALEAVAAAAAATRAATEAAQASAGRIQELELAVEALRAQASAARDDNTLLRAQLTAAGGAGRWTMPLLFGVLVLTFLAAWLAWRLNELQRLRQAHWRAAAAPFAAPPASSREPTREPTAPVPFVTSEMVPLSAATPSAGRTPKAWPPPVPAMDSRPAVLADDASVEFVESGPVLQDETPQGVEPAIQRTQTLPPAPARGSDEGLRDVSIEELIDLEQQADFFIVLGQDQSAIDLLVEHLRRSSGGSPLAYLKLLEIHQRLGDRAAYERTRGRFNHRFNAHAPDWGTSLQQGRSLEDYAEVLPRLQQAWPRPLDAMAELEALLFRKSRGELFELPAYREVLFLYALARDLLDREPVERGTVDVLLPLGADTPKAGTHETMPGSLEERPTAPVDLDLSHTDEARGSIFDPLTTTQAPTRSL
jgi:pilus assembly protein FimV